ncbi:glycine oxidase [Cryobacterium psychrotolerans]|uniref:glycine oxidase n=1 Tax=Cryobacterium psychrotolerans TaxID=386301 RepID=A0A1G9DEZ6_9MICO|nr:MULTISPECIES: glycine oxidase ThiO [Cryobacterium]TFD44311.1 glycine oxidase ThiO [Cryobacterium sp. TMT1-2-1]TFD89541.1 glycine oxidase ThiO [Cryobacterium psychrotolerans]SDK62451.1 glycine oxidase [Cryobacterium psychrotolerans]
MAERAVDVVVIGAGIIGLGIAWTAARSGRTVTVLDPAPATGATYAAAGMLAPVSELHYQEEDLLELTLASAALYPAFVESLGVAAADAGYRTTRTITVGADAADRRSLADLREAQLRHGLAVEPLTIRAARAQEPLLSPQLSSAFNTPQDHQVDPRLLAHRLESAIGQAAAANHWTQEAFLRQNAAGLVHENPADASSRVVGVTLADGSTVTAGEVIVANGLAAARLGGLPDWLALPLRPVYGEILRLRVPEHLRPLLTATIRGLVRGLPVYLVPRSDGTVVLGATQREDGSAAVSAGGVHQLLRDAQVLVPAVAELELIEVTARARPGTPDNAPLLGRVARGPGRAAGDIPGLVIATGFFRHGVLLTPIAAEHCLHLLDGTADARWARFLPDRFSAHPVPAAQPEGVRP